MSFEALGLDKPTLKAVLEAGYSIPTPIQRIAIPLALMGRDIMGIAQTGTGKTAGFILPMIDIISSGRSKARMPRALILCPTRELAAQAAENFVKYSKYSNLNMVLVIGGESFTDQEKALDKSCDVLIATPGRLLDLFERGKVLLNDVKYFVIDEADRMLDMGFIPDVERISKLVPVIRQTLLFSATMEKEIKKLCNSFLINPKEIAIAPQATAASTISQAVIFCNQAEKQTVLRSLLKTENITNGFIFCNRKKDVDTLYQSLEKYNFNVVALHGDMLQSKRTEMLASFKSGKAGLLVCSDVAARGLDISAVPFVINFDLPHNTEDYVHRIGRTGRAGMQGKAYTLVLPSDIKQLQAIETLMTVPIPRIDSKKLKNGTIQVLDPSNSEIKKTTTKKPVAKQKPKPDVTPKPETQSKRVAKTKVQSTNARKPLTNYKETKNRRGHDPDVGTMEHPDDVIAFGGYTPSFLKVTANTKESNKSVTEASNSSSN